MNESIVLKKLEIPCKEIWNFWFREIKLITSISVIYWLILLNPQVDCHIFVNIRMCIYPVGIVECNCCKFTRNLK